LPQSNWPVWATEPIEIKDFDHRWTQTGNRERQTLFKLLSPFSVGQVEHMGSTSIPGLPAKPIIDLMAEIQSFERLDEISALLHNYEWHYVPYELDNNPWRRFFVKVRDDKRIAHLHLMLEGDERWQKQLLFRDRLRESPQLLDEYKNLKLDLAKKFEHNREAYTEAKSKFIERVLS
jgi:GrpB-like predicted nucleotidyltransferase (UPF0157 family)